MSNASQPQDERGRVVPFRRTKPPRGTRAEDTGPVKGVEQYAREDESDNYRQRMINNGLALTFCVLLVLAGVWLANTIAQMRQNQDCVLSGRRNCAQVNVPPADPGK